MILVPLKRLNSYYVDNYVHSDDYVRKTQNAFSELIVPTTGCLNIRLGATCRVSHNQVYQ
jgi:hypothetical protein